MLNIYKRIKFSIFSLIGFLLLLINAPPVYAATINYADVTYNDVYYENGDLVWEMRLKNRSGRVYTIGGEGESTRSPLMYVQKKVNRTTYDYPDTIAEVAAAAGIDPNGRQKQYGGALTLNYSGFSVTYSEGGNGGWYILDGRNDGRRITRMGMNQGTGSLRIKLRIPHGTSTNSSEWEETKIRYSYKRSSSAGSGNSHSWDSEERDLSDMVEHVKNCNGGNWQSDANQHWKICGTCGQTKMKI